MYITVLEGIRFLVPDKYMGTIIEKLGWEHEFRELDDVKPFKSADFVDVLIDDPRYTVSFMAKNLDFINDSSALSLLSERSAEPHQRDQSFNSLLHDKGPGYLVYNLAEGEPLLQEQSSFRVVVCGLGDVGGTLLSGLRLLGDESISELLIYDRNETKLQRWYREIAQILRPDNTYMPPVRIISKEELFSGDVFVFCVSAGVPSVGKEAGRDVRLSQLTANSAILQDYLDMASEAGYKGSFFIVSDPVDQLCMCAHRNSQLRSQQIRGFGLGVMYARAIFHARELGLPTEEIRVFGPHGQGLRVMNSISDYDPELSQKLTELTVTENLRIREAGFKPYIAPALSSGALSILAALKGDWHYSSTLLDGIWFGARNRQRGLYVEYETLPFREDNLQHFLTTRSLLLESMEGQEQQAAVAPANLTE